MAKKLGTSDVKLEALAHAQNSDHFDERERLAIHLAEVMTLNPHGYTDADFSRLREHFTEGEIVELVSAIGLFNYFNRANDLLQMEITKPATTEELEGAGLLASR